MAATVVAYEDGGTEYENPSMPYKTLEKLNVYADPASGNSPKGSIPAGEQVAVDKWHTAEYKLDNGNWIQILRAHVLYTNDKGFAADGWVRYKAPDEGYKLKLLSEKITKAAADKAKAKPAVKKPGKVYEKPLPSNPYAGEESSAVPVALGLGAAALLLWKLWPK